MPKPAYEFVSCLASLHHVPFATVAKLRDALTPGGVLGLAGPSTPADLALDLASAPVSLVARGVVRAGEWLDGGPDPLPQPPVRLAFPRLGGLRREARGLLAGSRIRTRPFWRFLLTCRKPDTDHPAGG